MKVFDILTETDDFEKSKTRNPVARAAQRVAKGSGSHKDKKRAEKQGDVKHKKDLMPVDETATAGATSAGSIASVSNPQIALGDKTARKSYGTKGASARPPKAVQAKNSDGTAKNALDLPNTSLFGGSNIKR